MNRKLYITFGINQCNGLQENLFNGRNMAAGHRRTTDAGLLSNI